MFAMTMMTWSFSRISIDARARLKCTKILLIILYANYTLVIEFQRA